MTYNTVHFLFTLQYERDFVYGVNQILKYKQWRNQPDNLVQLCKFQIIIIIHYFKIWLFSQSQSITD